MVIVPTSFLIVALDDEDSIVSLADDCVDGLDSGRLFVAEVVEEVNKETGEVKKIEEPKEVDEAPKVEDEDF